METLLGRLRHCCFPSSSPSDKDDANKSNVKGRDAFLSIENTATTDSSSSFASTPFVFNASPPPAPKVIEPISTSSATFSIGTTATPRSRSTSPIRTPASNSGKRSTSPVPPLKSGAAAGGAVGSTVLPVGAPRGRRIVRARVPHATAGPNSGARGKKPGGPASTNALSSGTRRDRAVRDTQPIGGIETDASPPTTETTADSVAPATPVTAPPSSETSKPSDDNAKDEDASAPANTPKTETADATPSNSAAPAKNQPNRFWKLGALNQLKAELRKREEREQAARKKEAEEAKKKEEEAAKNKEEGNDEDKPKESESTRDGENAMECPELNSSSKGEETLQEDDTKNAEGTNESEEDEAESPKVVDVLPSDDSGSDGHNMISSQGTDAQTNTNDDENKNEEVAVDHVEAADEPLGNIPCDTADEPVGRIPCDAPADGSAKDAETEQPSEEKSIEGAKQESEEETKKEEKEESVQGEEIEGTGDVSFSVDGETSKGKPLTSYDLTKLEETDEGTETVVATAMVEAEEESATEEHQGTSAGACAVAEEDRTNGIAQTEEEDKRKELDSDKLNTKKTTKTEEDERANESSKEEVPTTQDKKGGEEDPANGRDIKKDEGEDGSMKEEPSQKSDEDSGETSPEDEYINFLCKISSDKEKDEWGRTPLARLILDGGANLEKEDVEKVLKAWPEAITESDRLLDGTPLHHAMEKGCPPEVISVLLKAAPDTIRTRAGTTRAARATTGPLPLWSGLTSLTRNDESILLLIKEWPEGLERIRPKADEAWDEEDKIEKNASKAAAAERPTPLHLAVERGCSPSIIEAMLEHCPSDDLGVTDSHGRTPFTRALYYAGSKSLYGNNDVYTPDTIAVLRMLLNAFPQAANPYWNLNNDDRGWTALHYALEGNAPPTIVQMLLSLKFPEGDDEYANTDKDGGEESGSYRSPGDMLLLSPSTRFCSRKTRKSALGRSLLFRRFFGGPAWSSSSSAANIHNDVDTMRIVLFALKKNREGEAEGEESDGMEPVAPPTEGKGEKIDALLHWWSHEADESRRVNSVWGPTSLHGGLQTMVPNTSSLSSPQSDLMVKPLRLLLDACPEAVKEVDDDGKTLLHCAMANPSPNVEVVKMLLDLWPDAALVRAGEKSETPLHLAMSGQSVGSPKTDTAVRLLLRRVPEAGRQKGGRDWTPLRTAMERGSSPRTTASVRAVFRSCPDVFYEQVGEFRDRSSIYGAIRDGTHEAVFGLSTPSERLASIYLSAVVDEDLWHCEDENKEWSRSKNVTLGSRNFEPLGLSSPPDHHSTTPLHVACSHASIRMASEAIGILYRAHPEDIRTKATIRGGNRTFDGLPLHSACSNKDCNPPVLQQILSLYPEALQVEDGQGRVPFVVACLSGTSTDVVYSLLRAAPDVLSGGPLSLPSTPAATMASSSNSKLSAASFTFGSAATTADASVTSGTPPRRDLRKRGVRSRGTTTHRRRRGDAPAPKTAPAWVPTVTTFPGSKPSNTSDEGAICQQIWHSEGAYVHHQFLGTGIFVLKSSRNAESTVRFFFTDDGSRVELSVSTLLLSRVAPEVGDVVRVLYSSFVKREQRSQRGKLTAIEDGGATAVIERFDSSRNRTRQGEEETNAFNVPMEYIVKVEPRPDELSLPLESEDHSSAGQTNNDENNNENDDNLEELVDYDEESDEEAEEDDDEGDD